MVALLAPLFVLRDYNIRIDGRYSSPDVRTTTTTCIYKSAGNHGAIVINGYNIPILAHHHGHRAET